MIQYLSKEERFVREYHSTVQYGQYGLLYPLTSTTHSTIALECSTLGSYTSHASLG